MTIINIRQVVSRRIQAVTLLVMAQTASTDGSLFVTDTFHASYFSTGTDLCYLRW